MSNEELVAAMSEAGHFPQLLEIESWSDCGVVEASRYVRTAPLIRTFRDSKGRWILTVFGDWYCQVPNDADVPAATSEMLRAMDRRMRFAEQVIQRFKLVELDPSEFETGNE